MEFGRQLKAWGLFQALLAADANGRSREELMQTLWPDRAVEENNLDQQKSKLNDLLEPIGIEVSTKNGRWWLSELGRA